MSDVLGRRIECHFVDQDRYKAQFVRLGMSQAMAQGMSDMARAKSEGLDNHEPRTPQNSVGMTFEQWCVEVLRPAVEK
jgi:hypothetical protein